MSYQVDRDTEAVQRTILEACALDLIVRELWRRGFIVIPWEGDIEFTPEYPDVDVVRETLTA